MDTPFDSPRRPLLLGSAVAALLCAATLLATSPGLPMAWDEGNAILRAEKIRQGEWQYTTEVEGHPALYGIVIAAGQWISSGWLRPLDAARFGPMMLFGLASGAMFYRMGRDYSVAAGVATVSALMLLPRMFAHAHFASFDGPLVSCWILTWATFAPARRGWAARILWGIMLGTALSCKATGWIAPLPFLVWTVIYRDRPAAKTLAVGLPAALVTFFVLNPPLWHDPIRGWLTFFDLNLHRAAHPGRNIPTQFLGEIYHLGKPLPWFNTLFWTAVSVPLGTLLLAGLGLVTVICRWRRDRPGILLAANWLVLPIIRAVPGTPPHDGVRLFLPSFAFLAALAGVGCLSASSWAARRWSDQKRLRGVALTALLLLYAGSASSLFWYAPQWLSYYNLLIGGLPGATAMGMEPTYYWDGLDRSVLDWLHRHTGPGEKIRFGAASVENLRLMRRWRVLRRNTEEDAPGEFRWYVLQHRPSGWQPPDRWLIDHAQPPAHRKTIHRVGVGPWRLDVPLVEVYDYRRFLQARAECEATTSAATLRHCFARGTMPPLQPPHRTLARRLQKGDNPGYDAWHRPNTTRNRLNQRRK
jgi:hypothetical protein